MKSQWMKWLSEPGQIRIVSVEASALVHELCIQQGLQGVSQLGYAEAVVGALLIASTHKSSESINLNAQGSALYRQALIDASPEGRVRGFLREETDIHMHTYGEFGTNGPWGSGVLSILYTQNDESKYPYTGMVPISTGFMDEAINEYYRDSEQLVSKLGLAVEFREGEVKSARGALVQALGGASNEELNDIEKLTVVQMRELAGHADNEERFINLTSGLLNSRKFKQLEAPQLLTSFCNCSQERIERALLLAGQEDVMDALEQDEYMTLTCDFCRREYKVSRERLKALFSRDPSRLQ